MKKSISVKEWFQERCMTVDLMDVLSSYPADKSKEQLSHKISEAKISEAREVVDMPEISQADKINQTIDKQILDTRACIHTLPMDYVTVPKGQDKIGNWSSQFRILICVLLLLRMIPSVDAPSICHRVRASVKSQCNNFYLDLSSSDRDCCAAIYSVGVEIDNSKSSPCLCSISDDTDIARIENLYGQCQANGGFSAICNQISRYEKFGAKCQAYRHFEEICNQAPKDSKPAPKNSNRYSFPQFLENLDIFKSIGSSILILLALISHFYKLCKMLSELCKRKIFVDSEETAKKARAARRSRDAATERAIDLILARLSQSLTVEAKEVGAEIGDITDNTDGADTSKEAELAQDGVDTPKETNIEKTGEEATDYAEERKHHHIQIHYPAHHGLGLGVVLLLS